MVHKTNGNPESVLSKSATVKPEVFERQTTEYEDLSKKFTKSKNDFSKQFAHIYAIRLCELREVLTEKVKSAWGNIKIVKLADLENLEGAECVIIGTLYKHQQWKPSILRELSEDHQLTLPEPRADYCSDKDQPFLEDEILRIKLVGEKVDLKFIVTGIVCAIRGRENSDGTFMVNDWCFPGCTPQRSLPTFSTKGKLVLVSGLDLAKNSKSLAVNLLSEWLCGMAGTTTVQKESTSIVRCIIAGNTMKSKTTTHSNMGHSEGKAQDSAVAKENIAATQKADEFLSSIAECCCLTVMPGEHDPTNLMLPQRPLHPCLLPKTSRFQSFKSATNPWISKIGERVIMGSSGQPIDDIMKASGESSVSPIEWLERTLMWRHLCPTAPDTLLACPYYDKDLFIMKECPDIYFVGNTKKFETKVWKGDEGQTVRLISVPEFCGTSVAVIIDLENLDTNYIHFGSDM